LTGPAEGKLGLDATVYLISDRGRIKLEDPFVCIHVKGYSRARVTHLDVEHDILDNLILPKSGRLHEIKGVKGGIEIRLEETKEIECQGQKLNPQSILISCPTLNEILSPSQSSRTWVGGKFGGIYIGFRKPEIERMEQVARDKFGMIPK
jgi:hypothetical protein